MDRKKERLYKDMAWIWPVMSPPEDYIEEGEFFSNIAVSNSKIQPKTLLHLGCGGGHIDKTFKQHFDITGIDLERRNAIYRAKSKPGIEILSGRYEEYPPE